MDLPSPRYFQPPPTFSSSGEPPLESDRSYYGKGKEKPFVEAFSVPLCNLNLKETSEFVKSLPISNTFMTDNNKGFFDNSVQRRREGIRIEAPPTPGRPVFSFTSGNFARKNFPSKWDDAEKWLISTSYNDSPAQTVKPSESVKIAKQCESFNHQMEAFGEKSRVTEEEKFSRAVSSIKEGVIHEFRQRDVGTEMAPLGSSATSRCQTPFKSSPARHSTPASRSGHSNSSNSTIDIARFAKIQLGTYYDSLASNWSSKEEEEEEISKSLRHCETDIGFQNNTPDSRATV